MLRVNDATPPPAFTPVMTNVTDVVIVTLGVPDSKPLTGFKLSPLGRAGLTLNPVTPPEGVTTAAKLVATAPFVNTALDVA